LINLCLQKEPENRVANGSFLSKNRNIENLIYQLDHGIPPSDFCFSDNIVDVVQAVNAKLLQENEKIANQICQHLYSRRSAQRSWYVFIDKNKSKTKRFLFR